VRKITQIGKTTFNQLNSFQVVELLLTSTRRSTTSSWSELRKEKSTNVQRLTPASS